MKFSDLVELFRDTAAAWSQEQVPRLAAALAYYTTFSLAPLLVLVIALVGFLWEGSVARDQLLNQITDQFGSDTALFVQNLISRASISSNGGWVTGLGGITLVLGALGIFGQLRSSLNRIWNVRPMPPSGFVESLRINLLNRAVSFGLILLIGGLMLISIVASAAAGTLADLLGGPDQVSNLLLESINFASSFLVITVLFALVFRILPDVEIAWKDTWLGAAVTALLFLIGKTLLGLYLGNSDLSSGFGAAGSLVLIMVFIYYAAQIFFFGAVFTRVYAKRFGSHIVPSDNALPRSEIKPVDSDLTSESPDKSLASSSSKQPEQKIALRMQKINRSRQNNTLLFSLTFLGAFLAGYLARSLRAESDGIRGQPETNSADL